MEQKNAEGKDAIVNGYNVVLENTILFAEGGGQPCDWGTMDNLPVLDVQRKGAEAHHFVLEPNPSPPFKVGDIVKCTVDWKRRNDHMQQHSGETLLQNKQFRSQP